MRRKKIIANSVTVGAFASEGKCIVKVEGKVTFIEGVAPGDVIDVKVTRRKKNYQEGVATRIIEYSKERATPFCDHYGLCGGCKWQHLFYEKQLEYKRQQVVDNLERIAAIPMPEVNRTLPSPKTKYYRNKLEFTFSPNRWLTDAEIQSGKQFNRNGLGFHLPGRFDKILDIDLCFLQPEPSNDIRNEVRIWAHAHDLSFYNLLSHTGFLRNLIVRTSTNGEVMVILQVGEPQTALINQLLNHLIEKFPSITSLYYVINPKKNETFHDLETVLFYGSPFITEKIRDLTFRIGPKSFFQTNPEQAEQLYQHAGAFANLTGKETVYDLYSGTGTIALYMANKAKKVIGIESIPEAVEDAKINAQTNKIKNVEFVTGDIKDSLSEGFVDKYGLPDLVILDPPRAGMHPDATKALLNLSPARIIYISCNPATQARDMKLLSGKYDVEAVQPVDMFPHTQHVENIVSLILR
jgi:23S rRNA (uracil1939-C5)-methyltransferase